MNNFSLKAMPFDSEVITNPKTGQEEYDRVAHSKDPADLVRAYFSNGILVQGSDLLTNELQVVNLSAMSCVVKPGGIIINGRTGFLENEQTLEFDVGTQNPRIDRVVAELNVAERNIYIRVLKGIPAADPKPVDIMQTEDIYQIPLAQVRVNANQSVIASVTDERAGHISNVLLNQAPSKEIMANTVGISETLRTLYGLSTDNANVENVLQKAYFISSNTSSYMAFCANVNMSSVNAAFGMNNEANILNIGKQLAMYSWFKGANKSNYPFSNLIKLDNISQVYDTPSAITEILSSNIRDFFISNEYVYSHMPVGFTEFLLNNGFLNGWATYNAKDFAIENTTTYGAGTGAIMPTYIRVGLSPEHTDTVKNPYSSATVQSPIFRQYGLISINCYIHSAYVGNADIHFKISNLEGNLVEKVITAADVGNTLTFSFNISKEKDDYLKFCCVAGINGSKSTFISSACELQINQIKLVK